MDGEIIAASHDLDRIHERINYAEENASVYVLYNGKIIPIDEYEAKTAPTIYRFAYSDSRITGFIAVIDIIKGGRLSQPYIFDDIGEIYDFIVDRQKKDDYFTIYGRGKERLGLSSIGLNNYRLSKEQKDINRLSERLAEERKRVTNDNK